MTRLVEFRYARTTAASCSRGTGAPLHVPPGQPAIAVVGGLAGVEESIAERTRRMSWTASLSQVDVECERTKS